MTHEFKTPLSSILIASNYLKQHERIKSDEKLEKYTNIIIAQSNKLNTHIETILNSAKSDNSPLQLDKKELDVLPILSDVIENIQLKYPNSNIQIVTEEKEIFIKADAFHFTNLVYNLLDNAIKYCEEKPEITIRLSKEIHQIQIDFIDNGIGISNKNLPFIFDKFYRIQSSKSNEINGFGLGLYYVKKICNLHHWKINAQNNTNHGITISLLIPTE
jgi:two-component system, OmpR family, phosphate regulon sensor histidine kinase PhoR